MTSIISFTFEGAAVRIIDRDGEPWFVAKDVSERLGYTWSGSRIAHIPEEWKGVTSVVTPGGEQQMAVLFEAGVNFFLARSDKPAALPMRKWLAGEVLPAIRRTGGSGRRKRGSLQPTPLVARKMRRSSASRWAA